MVSSFLVNRDHIRVQVFDCGTLPQLALHPQHCTPPPTPHPGTRAYLGVLWKVLRKYLLKWKSIVLGIARMVGDFCGNSEEIIRTPVIIKKQNSHNTWPNHTLPECMLT